MQNTAPDSASLAAPLRIGDLTARNSIALAPMAGLSDVPFREVAWRMGVGYMVSEMVSSQAQLWDTGKSRLRRIPVAGVQPIAVQIAGTEPAVMAAAARRHVDEGVEVVDINFGCPAKKVCRKAAGSALLAHVEQIAEIVAAVVDAAGVPVTVKTRTGLVPGDGLGISAALAAVEAGAQMVVLHGRSRACRFKGQAEYATAAALRAELTVPLLVNGDISCPADARRALQMSGADGVMIGRGALGQPWIFRELAGLAPLSLEARWHTVIQHVGAMHQFYGELMGPRIARKHVAAYLGKLTPEQQQAGLITAFQKITNGSKQLSWLARLADRALGEDLPASKHYSWG